MTTSLSRRTLFKATGTAAVAAALGGAFAQMPQYAAALGGPEMERLRKRWVDQLTGRKAIVLGDADFARAIGTLDSGIAKTLTLLESGENRSEVFTDAPFSKEKNIRTTYSRLAQLATGWATPGSDYEADADLLEVIRAGLGDTYRLIYNPNQEEFGNWWHWEIGAPRDLADTMAIVGPELSETEIADYCGAIDYYVPDPYYQFPDSRGKQLSEGANRVDLCQGIIIRSIVGGDADKLARAVSGLSDVWQLVETGNGFYQDGSFIQHGKVAYTGTYGLVLLSGLSKLFALLGGSEAAVSDPSRRIIFDAVEDSFAPFIHNQQMMDAVRGRAISREQERSHDNGHTAVIAILQLADAVDSETADRWRGLCRGWIERNTYDSILTGASVVRTAIVKTLLASGVSALPEPRGPKLFPSMDRATYRGPGWAASLGMSSRRIAWYECGNGENDKGYQTGSGMTYLYGQDQGHFDDGFWPTADLTRLPGITVDRTPLPPKVEGQWGAASPNNDWTGSAGLGEYAMVGQHLIAPGDTGLTARKAWFFTPTMLLCLGAGIRTGTDEAVETIVEQRNLGADGGNRLVVDGDALDANGSGTALQDPTWAHLEGTGGYVFLDHSALRAVRQRRTGSWADINNGGPTAELTREFVTIVDDHGTRPDNATYAYVLVPGATAEETAALARRHGLRIVANNDDVQSVEYQGRHAIAFWRGSAAGRWSSASAAILVTKRGPAYLELSVADPTQNQDSVTITIASMPYRTVESDVGVSVQRRRGSVAITVPTAGRAGVAVTLRLTP